MSDSSLFIQQVVPNCRPHHVEAQTALLNCPARLLATVVNWWNYADDAETGEGLSTVSWTLIIGWCEGASEMFPPDSEAHSTLRFLADIAARRMDGALAPYLRDFAEEPARVS